MMREIENLFSTKKSALVIVNKNKMRSFRNLVEERTLLGTRLGTGWKERSALLEATTSYSPESNRAAEHLNRMRMAMSRRTTIHVPNMKRKMWAKPANTAYSLGNLLVSKRCKIGKTLYEALHEKRPNRKHLRRLNPTQACINSRSNEQVSWRKEQNRVFWLVIAKWTYAGFYLINLVKSSNQSREIWRNIGILQ